MDTRSDIYSLGVLLYELLTGRTPFDTQKLLTAGYDAVMRTIREEEPPKPSTRLSTLAGEELSAVAANRGAEPARLNRLVRGDLDWIVMKALEKDRKRRYETAASMARDIERHLRAEPVSAAAPSPAYRLAKFVRRHRVTVGAALVVAAALLVATVVSLQSAFVAHKARGVADAERDKAYQAQRAEAAQRTMAEASAEESRLRLVRLNTSQAVQLMDRGDWFGASLWFCDVLSRAGTNASADTVNRLRLGVNLSYAPRLVRMWFHGRPLNQASFSPDGRWVLTAGRDGVARIWDLATDQPVGAPMTHAGPVLGAEFSRDGRYVVTACEDRTARVWEAASGKVVSPPLAHRLPLRRVLLSSDGRQVVTASSRDWLSWSGDERPKLKVQSAQSEIRLWETLSGRELYGNYWRNTNLMQLVASPAEHRVAAAYPDGEVCLLDERLHVDRRLGDWSGSCGRVVKALGKVIEVGHAEEPAVTEFPGQDKPVWVSAHTGPVNDLAFSPDGKCLATAGADGSLRIWDLGNGEWSRTLRAVGELQTGSSPELVQVAFSPEGQRLLALAKDGTVAFWSVPSGQAAGQLANPITGASSAVFSPDGRRVAVLRAATSGTGEVRIWDVASGRAVSPTLPHAGAVTSACFSPDGSLLLTASLDGSARVWNLASGVPPLPPLHDLSSPTPTQTNFPGSEHPVVALFSRDGSRLATLERGRVARLWDTATGRPVAPGIEHGQALATAAFSHDGRRIAVAGGVENGQARVYDTATGKPVSPALLLNAPVRRVAFSPDGRWLVTSGETGVRLWDTASGKPAPLPANGVVAVRDLVFSPDGRWMATCAGSSPFLPDHKADWQVQVWRVATGDALAPAKDIAGAQPRLLFSPDGHWLVVGGEVVAEPTSENTLGFIARVTILNARTGAALGQSVELREPVSGLLFSSGLRALVRAGRSFRQVDGAGRSPSRDYRRAAAPGLRVSPAGNWLGGPLAPGLGPGRVAPLGNRLGGAHHGGAGRRSGRSLSTRRGVPRSWRTRGPGRTFCCPAVVAAGRG